MQITTDNNGEGYKIEDSQDLRNFQKVGDKKISEFTNLLIFPNTMNKHKDAIGNEIIFSLQGSMLKTRNIVGFIGINGSELKIRSRFDKDNKEDYFLHYMLKKVLSINLFDLKHSYNEESILDFLIYLFPYYLERALQQGLFKEYRHKEYNDANVRGTIDIGRHIKKNIPFSGLVAYRTKEYSYDNRVTQLIRHTIEFIRQKEGGLRILTCNSDTLNGVSQIRQATPSYEKNSKQSIINKNLRPISHPYFSEYKQLQQLCLQILRYKGLKYGASKNKVYGILFDASWLWEEYLYTLLKQCSFEHPENKSRKANIYLFSDPEKYKRYPDFYKENVILDAKYKTFGEYRNPDRNDLHQIITYMYIEKAKKGGFIYPTELDSTYNNTLGKLSGYGGEITLWGFSIPRETENYRDFCKKMNNNEDKFKQEIDKIYPTHN